MGVGGTTLLLRNWQLSSPQRFVLVVSSGSQSVSHETSLTHPIIIVRGSASVCGREYMEGKGCWQIIYTRVRLAVAMNLIDDDEEEEDDDDVVAPTHSQDDLHNIIC